MLARLGRGLVVSGAGRRCVSSGQDGRQLPDSAGDSGRPTVVGDGRAVRPSDERCLRSEEVRRAMEVVWCGESAAERKESGVFSTGFGLLCLFRQSLDFEKFRPSLDFEKFQSFLVFFQNRCLTGPGRGLVVCGAGRRPSLDLE